MDRDPGENLPLEPLTDFPEHLLPNLSPIPEMFAINAATEADSYRHGIARVELLHCLAADPDVCDRLDAWASAIGLLQASEDLARILERAAQLRGLPHRAYLWGARDVAPREPIDEAQEQAVAQQITEAFERYREATTRAEEVREAAERYVRDELGLHWGPWLAWTLFAQVLQDSWMYAIGVEREVVYQYAPDDPTARDFSFTFANHPGETTSALRQRFAEEAHAAYAQIQPATDAPEPTPLGRQRKDLEAKARRNARWFYRRKVRQEPISRIAQDCHVSRVNVYDGIKEAERVLSLTPYFFGEPQEET